MKRREGPPEEPLQESPYRKMDYRTDNADKALALHAMEKEISTEKKFKVSIPLPENIKIGDTVPLFYDALKTYNAEPKDIVPYSVATGILKFARPKKTPPPNDYKTEYKYVSQENSNIYLTVLVHAVTKEATVLDIKTKLDAEQQAKEKQKELIVEKWKEHVAAIEQLLYGGNVEEKEYELYLSTLKELQKKLERIQSSVQNKIEAIEERIK